MKVLQQMIDQYGDIDYGEMGPRHLEQLRDGLKVVSCEEITDSKTGKSFIDLLRKFREAVSQNDKLHGENYPALLNSLLSVGEDGLYSNNLRFIFELIQNVDDCEYLSVDDRRLDMHFDLKNNDTITLRYNEVGFTPFNVFAITGIAEAAKNVSATKNEIGEKGIGFKSVFGVAKKVLIRSGWFSFELYKEDFTIPVSSYSSEEYCVGTEMTLYVPGRAADIYNDIKKNYCRKDALFSRNPLLFLNKLTTLRIYFDSWRSMEFHVSRQETPEQDGFNIERNVEIAVRLKDHDSGLDTDIEEKILCTRYSYPVIFSKQACMSRYGNKTLVGGDNGKPMLLRVVMPYPDDISSVGTGALYSFLPTQLKLTVPMVCHVPFKLDASREFVDPQENNLWFQEASKFLSELIEYAYQDWKNTVKEKILLYLPGVKESFFANNNGKERCLSTQKCFSGQHFLDMPLIYGIDGSYYSAKEIICFDHEEKIKDPEKVYSMMKYGSVLFLSTGEVNKYGIHSEKNVKNKLFKRALVDSSITSDALEYLDSEDYTYTEKQLPDMGSIALTTEQIKVIFQHKKLAELLQKISCESIKKNMRPEVKIKDGCYNIVSDVLSEGFELSEAPQQVEKYLTYCREACLLLDIEEFDYLPLYNGVVLASNNTLSSFASFCYAVDQKDTFAIRIKLKDASKRLNQVVEEETGSSSDYLRSLRNIRLLIKESLGVDGYRNYINLILRSGTQKGRFIQELLQNADDCNYSPDVSPTFTLTQKANTVVTEYNEVGFTRANIRSITAIGESTKNELFKHEISAIGEKGVGFKTIFAIASKVTIRSGEYAFYLTDKEPTIPNPLKAIENGNVDGTNMEILLKDETAFPSLNSKDILELCLCLRKLRTIKIESHSVTIDDTNDTRTITIDNKKYIFKRFVHSFTVSDSKALVERSNGNREVSPDQTIVCFVPEKGGQSEYALYCGLPTKHKIRIPLVIDAPFALTTSREEIETGSSTWNNIVRAEMYSAILKVINSLKLEERSKVFRFMKFVPRFSGKDRVYVNDISDCDYLTSYDFLSKLKVSEILPTFDNNVFSVPRYKKAFRFPDAVDYLFRKLSEAEFIYILPSSIIDIDSNENESTLNALECESASFDRYYPIIEKYSERYIGDKDFSSKLYELLKDKTVKYLDKIKNLAIIPVYGRNTPNIEYIKWKDDSIFVKEGSKQSGSDYYVLVETILPKTDCETIFDRNINEMNDKYERRRYNENLEEFIINSEPEQVYKHLILEFRNGALIKNNSLGTLKSLEAKIPFRNELGELVFKPLFLCREQTGYFYTKMVQSMIIHKECEDLAKFIERRELKLIHYEDIDYHEILTEDDIEMLLDDYFDNSEEILRGFYNDGLLPDELLVEHNLEYLAFGHDNSLGKSYTFPNEPVGGQSIANLKLHIQKLWKNPIKIVSVPVQRSIRKGQNSDGSQFDLGIKDAREGALHTYTPEGAHKHCFCQMCHGVKPYQLIEVNNIEQEPDYYFPQLRIALCLECSKKFEILRNNRSVRESFIESIEETTVSPSDGTVEISIGDQETIKFTGKHFAEIQEILRQKPKK